MASRALIRSGGSLLLRGKVYKTSPVRALWGWGRSRMDPFGEMRSMMREMERTFDTMNRDFARFFDLPRSLPVLAAGEPSGNNYRLSIDLSGFKPEDIQVNLKGHMLEINAKMEHKGEDGSRFYQEISREYLLPEKIDSSQLKSLLDRNGVLYIEAPLPQGEDKPREIPINRGEQQQLTGAEEGQITS